MKTIRMSNKALHWTERFYNSNNLIDRVADQSLYYDQFRIDEEIDITCVYLSSNKLKPQLYLHLACGPNACHTAKIIETFSPLYVFCLDLNEDFIRLAQRDLTLRLKNNKTNLLAKKNISRTVFLRGDMRQLCFRNGTFDLVTMYGNSFGFFDHQTNLSILSNIQGILSKKGIFLVTVADFYFASSFTKNNMLIWSDEIVTDTKRILSKSRRYFDVATQTSICKTKYIDNNNNSLLNEQVRTIAVYPTHTNDERIISLRDMGKTAGFNMIDEVKLQKNTGTFGLMKKLKIIVFQK